MSALFDSVALCDSSQDYSHVVLVMSSDPDCPLVNEPCESLADAVGWQQYVEYQRGLPAYVVTPS